MACSKPVTVSTHSGGLEMECSDNTCLLDMQNLPEEIIEHILRQLSPYRDFKNATLVCRQWHRLIQGTHHLNHMA